MLRATGNPLKQCGLRMRVTYFPNFQETAGTHKFSGRGKKFKESLERQRQRIIVRQKARYNQGVNYTGAEAETGELVKRIVNTTSSPQSVPFYRRVIRQLGDGIVEEARRTSLQDASWVDQRPCQVLHKAASEPRLQGWKHGVPAAGGGGWRKTGSKT